jgi:hypothetical protein
MPFARRDNRVKYNTLPTLFHVCRYGHKQPQRFLLYTPHRPPLPSTGRAFFSRSVPLSPPDYPTTLPRFHRGARGHRISQSVSSHGSSNSSFALLLSSGFHFSILLANCRNCAFSSPLSCCSALSKFPVGISEVPRQHPVAKIVD